MGTSGIQFTGLASGVDTKSIVDQLIQVASVPITTQQTQLAREKKRQSTLGDLSSKIAALKTASDAVRDVTFWAGGPRGLSGETASYGVTATSGAAKASYAIQVKRLATADVWVQGATNGSREFGTLSSGVGVFATGASKLTDLTNTSGTSLGLAAGQSITLATTKGGQASTKSFAVTATSTLDDLKAFVQTSIPGATVEIGSGGRLRIKSGVGTDQEVTSASLSTGGAAALFDASMATSTATASATGLGSIQADDTLHITSGTLSFDVAVKAGWTMDQVATAITAANGGVSAATAGGRLRIAGNDTGTANAVSITSTGTTAADLGFSHVVTAQNALVSVDGQDIQTASNNSTDLIPGATVQLKATSQSATSASTDPKYIDPDAATQKVQSMVDAYNQVMLTINGQVTEKKVIDPKTSADQLAGVLFGDSTLNSIRSSLQTAMASTVGGLVLGKNLSSAIGLGTAAFGAGGTAAMDGQLQFDAGKFKTALASDPDSVKNVLTNVGSSSAMNGFAQRLSDLSQSFTSTGGLLSAKIDGSNAEVTRINDVIDRMQARLDDERTRLTTQFTAMETAISQLKSSQSQALAQLGSSSG